MIESYGLSLNMTNTCNMKCNFCYRAKANKSYSDHMSIENARHILDKVLKDPNFHGYIQFLGAEPSMNFECIKYVMDRCGDDIEYNMTSNGYFLDYPDTFDYIRRMDEVIISIESTEHLFNITRGGKGLHELVDKAIAIGHPNLRFSVTLTKKFFDELEDFIPLYNKIIESGASISFKDLDAIDNGYEDIFQYTACLKILKDVFDWEPSLNDFEKSSCALDSNLSINPDLSILPCLGFAGFIDWDLKFDDIEDILSAINKMIEMFAVRTDNAPGFCKGCVLEHKFCRNRCEVSGGIRLYNSNRDIFDHQCEMRILKYFIAKGDIKL